MGFFSFKSCVSGHDIMNDYGSEGLYDGMAIILPNNTIISGEYDGYGRIGNDDIYSLMARIICADKVKALDAEWAKNFEKGEDDDLFECRDESDDRDLIFDSVKTFLKDDVLRFTLDKFNWGEPILIDDVVSVEEGFDINTIIGKSMNDVKETFGLTQGESTFDKANNLIKVMHREEVEEGMKYEDLPISESAEGQGHWLSSYETRVEIPEEDEEDEY